MPKMNFSEKRSVDEKIRPSQGVETGSVNNDIRHRKNLSRLIVRTKYFILV